MEVSGCQVGNIPPHGEAITTGGHCHRTLPNTALRLPSPISTVRFLLPDSHPSSSICPSRQFPPGALTGVLSNNSTGVVALVDVVTVPRHQFYLPRWVSGGLRRPLITYLPTLVGKQFISFRHSRQSLRRQVPCPWVAPSPSKMARKPISISQRLIQ